MTYHIRHDSSLTYHIRKLSSELSANTVALLTRIAQFLHPSLMQPFPWIEKLWEEGVIFEIGDVNSVCFVSLFCFPIQKEYFTLSSFTPIFLIEISVVLPPPGNWYWVILFISPSYQQS